MIHFKTELKDTAFELVKTKDNLDLANDLIDIEKHLNALKMDPFNKAILFSAQSLDKKLHKKYPTIDVLLNAGSKMATVLGIPSCKYYTESEKLQSYLKQDTFGILCHSLLKEQVIDSAEAFIDHVD